MSQFNSKKVFTYFSLKINKQKEEIYLNKIIGHSHKRWRRIDETILPVLAKTKAEPIPNIPVKKR